MVVAVEAYLPIELVVVRLTVGQSLLLVVFLSLEWLLAVGAYEVLWVPGLEVSVDDPPLDWPPTRHADGGLHLVVAANADELSLVQLRHLLQRLLTLYAVEVVRVYGHIHMEQGLVFNRLEADLTQLLAGLLHQCVAGLAEGLSLELYEPNIC